MFADYDIRVSIGGYEEKWVSREKMAGEHLGHPPHAADTNASALPRSGIRHLPHQTLLKACPTDRLSRA
jgi:hypothetical protein